LYTALLRKFFFGLAFLIEQIAVILGPILAGVFVDRLTWRWCFYINLIVASTFLGLVFLRRPSRAYTARETVGKVWRSLDLAGILGLGGGLVILYLAVGMGGIDGNWNEPKVVALFSVSFVLVTVYCVLRTWEPDRLRTPLPALKQRKTVGSALMLFFVGASSMVALSWLSVYFQGVKSESATLAAIHCLPLTIAALLFFIIASSLHAERKAYIPLSLLAIPSLVAGTTLLSTLSSSSSMSHWFPYEILTGMSVGLLNIVSTLTEGPYLTEDFRRSGLYR